MSALSIQVPYQIFADSDGTPLDNGYVWIGTTNLDPRTNPVNVYFDAALTQVAPNPLRTVNGYVYNAGSPAQLYIDAANFSLRVEDKKSVLVYSFPAGSGISPNASGVVYTPAGTGAVATTVQAQLQLHDQQLLNIDGNLNFSTLELASSPVADADLMILRQGSSNKKLPASTFRAEFSTTAVAASVVATAAKVAAEAARDAALIQAGVYTTEALGRAAVADGVAFKVQGSGDVAAYEYRRTNSTTSVLIATYPSSAAVAQLLSDAPTGYAWSVCDKDGVTAAAIKDDGTFSVDGLEAKTLNGQPTSLLPSTKLKGAYAADVVHLISYGQSLALGNGGTFIQTNAQPYDSLMFTAGVRVQEGGAGAAANHAAFIPLVSVVNGGTGNGETPVANACATIKRLILAENLISYTAQSYQLLASAPGQSNTAIAGLKKGQTPYTNLMLDVTYGYSNAQALSKSYAVSSVFWSQGEADYNLATTYATYLTEFQQLYTDLNTDIKAATNQADSIKLIAYQCNDVTTTSPATVGLAQLQASKNNANILIACPSYCLPHLAAGNAHLTGPGYAMLGAYYGLVHKRTVIDGAVWKPLMPVSTQRQGVIVTLQLNVPSLPLVLDSTLLPAVANSGFTLVDNVGASIVISSVTVTGPSTVRVIAAATVPAGSKLRYGYLAGGGNLRDSQGDTFDAAIKVSAPLHNWCVAFEETLV